MAWLDQLQAASFRGVPFQVDTIEHLAGDHVVVREYPFQDLPTVFRMGTAAEEIKLSAYVIGEDYTDQRERLREVLTGEGELVHPTAGRLRVFVAGRYTIREAPSAEGGLARFDLTFIRADARRYPSAAPATPAQASQAAAVAQEAAVDDFAASWSLAGQPGWVAERALGRLTDALDGAWVGLSTASAGLGEFNASLIAGQQGLRSQLNNLVATPRRLADQIQTLFQLPAELSQAQARAYQSAFEWAFNLGVRVPARDWEVRVVPPVGSGLVMYGTGHADALAVDSATRSQLAALQACSDRLLETMATAAWVQAAAWLTLQNWDEAMRLRGVLHAQCMRLMRSASARPASIELPATAWHDAMLALHTQGLADLQARSRDLVRLTSYTPQGWEPVWLISYRLFGTAAYADEILAMNPHIEHPLLVPPGRALRIVNHG